MQVLTIPQPYAQLVVRGARPWMVRAVPTDHHGPLAIHAASAVPSHDVVRESRRDPMLAAQFAAQGWREREDLVGLPRGSVVGVVRLVRVTAIDALDG